MPAPVGNTNKADGKQWTQAVKRALAHKSGSTYREGLDLVAQKFVEAACNGDAWAMKELGDRIEGKPVQQVQADVDGSLTIELVRYSDKTAE